MNYTVKKENFEELLEEKSETFKIYKTLVDKIDSESITPKEYFDMVFKIEDLKEDVDIPEEYLDIVDGYLVDLLSYGSNMYTLDYSQEIIDEVYDERCDDWYLAEYVNEITYDIENNIFVFCYENTDINCAVQSDVSCKRAPEWFKAGWEGLTAKTLSEEEFNNYYCRLRNNNCFKNVSFGLESGELKGNYLKLKAVKSRIKDFLEANPQMVPTITKDVAV